MTELRSRDTYSAVGAKTSEPMAVENGLIEPRTPLKTLRFRYVVIKHYDTCFGFTGFNIWVPGFGVWGWHCYVFGQWICKEEKCSFGEKSGMLKCSEDIGVVNGKRKKVEFEVEGSSSSDEFDARNLERKVLDLELGVEKAGGRLDSSMTGLCLQNYDDGADELVIDK